MQIPEMDEDELDAAAEWPRAMPVFLSALDSGARSLSPRRPGFLAAHPVPGPKPEYAHVMAATAAAGPPPGTEQRGGDARPPPVPSDQQNTGLSTFVDNAMFVAAAAAAVNGRGHEQNGREVNSPYMLNNIVAMLGLDQESRDGGSSSSSMDDGVGDDIEDADGGARATDGRTAAKKRRRRGQQLGRREPGGALPDLPEPPAQPKPLAERGPAEFTAQEHMFLAWAKTTSTFTAKRQATVKMKINRIVSEAEFEDLDDEFFAGRMLCKYK